MKAASLLDMILGRWAAVLFIYWLNSTLLARSLRLSVKFDVL